MTKERNLPNLENNEIYKSLTAKFGEPGFNLLSINHLRSEMPGSALCNTNERQEWSQVISERKGPKVAPVNVLRSVGEIFNIAEQVCKKSRSNGRVQIHEFAPMGIKLR